MHIQHVWFYQPLASREGSRVCERMWQYAPAHDEVLLEGVGNKTELMILVCEEGKLIRVL